MDQSFRINDIIISVRFRKSVIHLVANHQLHKLVSIGWHPVDLFSARILKSYEENFGKPLRITPASLTIEILAHHYTYQICLFMRRIFPFGLFRLISFRACNIDCGEWKHDHNRWIWDGLSIFKKLIFLFVKKT
ncbi:MAG TPA: hypothetical protein PK191_08405 [Niabella sp.]|nr:hypothetical protein [Niabella sp.]HOZ95647.1 hypothetical protein [Niabella sp.]HQW13887.1 hypothetical protein [Niabella sp.]HQX19220.1 hypothetical protein [Niabella sp.]HQX42248.1 hypothetical protein [Niabella sp.]